VFAAVLAIERSDWHYLHDAILDELPNRPVTGAREPSRPRAVRTWEVRVLIEGLGGLMARRAHELDVVSLRKPVGRFPAGTSGTVVAEDPKSALVEIVTDDQTTDGFPTRDLLDDLVDVPHEDLEILRPARATAR
jgi:hypothetical protein